MIKDTHEQPDEGIQRVRSGRVGALGRSFCARVVGGHHPSGTKMCSPTWELPELCACGILWRLHHVGKTHN